MKTKMILKKIVLSIIKLRWVIASIVFLCLVFFKIHFSSMATFDILLPTVCSKEEQKNYTLFSEEKSIRSDEWGVHTPKYFAQKYNNYEKYSNRGGIKKTNVILDYYAPAKDLTLIGKPFNLGYILFGNEYGISFYFCMLEILLFMTAFEMFYIITKKNILTSIMGMFFIGFAPTMQWWLIPHLTIVFVYSMAIFCLVYYFFTSQKNWQKVLFSFLLVSAFVGFALSIFPSAQIVCAFSGLAILAVILNRDSDKIKFQAFAKISLLFAIVCSLAIVLHFIISSKFEFSLLSNTVYPGERMETGAKWRIDNLFTSLTSLFLPFKEIKDFSNNSEMADFIHFAPILLLLFIKINNVLKKEKDLKELYVGRVLFSTILVEIFYMCCGFSETLSKITLFRYANRMNLNYGFSSVIFTIWCFNIIWRKKIIFKIKECIVFCMSYAAIYLTLINSDLLGYVSLGELILEISIFTIVLFLSLKRYKKTASLIACGMMFTAGFGVNPICQGITPITNHPISKYIQQETKQNKDDLWLCCLDPFFIGPFFMANGARCLTSTNFYPDIELWKRLKINPKYFNLYNRYAHHTFKLTNKEKKIKLSAPDSIKILINPSDLKNLNIKYIVLRLGDSDHKDFVWPNYLKTTKQFEQDGIEILKLEYLNT